MVVVVEVEVGSSVVLDVVSIIVLPFLFFVSLRGLTGSANIQAISSIDKVVGLSVVEVVVGVNALRRESICMVW